MRNKPLKPKVKSVIMLVKVKMKTLIPGSGKTGCRCGNHFLIDTD